MSKVIYKVGEETFGFETKTQIVSKEQLFQFSEILMEEIREHKLHLNPQPKRGYIHDVQFVDDNGISVEIPDFKTIANITITNTI